MIFPLHFSSRDNDLVIMSEDNRHYSRQSWQLMASSFTLEIKVNKIFFILFSPFWISQETSQLCLNQLPETVRSSAPSSLLDVPMATSLAEVKGITDRYLIFFSPGSPLPLLSMPVQKNCCSLIFGVLRIAIEPPSHICSVWCIWKVCPTSPLSLGCLIYDIKQEKKARETFKSGERMLAQSRLQFRCLKNTACSIFYIFN